MLNRSRVREASALDDGVVLELMTEYMTWALATFERTYGFAMTGDAQHTAAALDAYRRPSGLIALAEVDGAPAGVAAMRVQNDGAVEIKRMFVRPEHRGAHVGSAMLDWMLALSRDELQAQTVRLDSNRFMDDAHRLYESRGFVERSAYDGSEIPADLQHLWRFFELRLG
ncbi:GNAT family N-acetyltransferase [Luteipulveratus mongoliensis]|uniref:GNAT family N-acetyltransferase n=1 Tax=Luteipulveratus mongoliensis TaxID=571913 RepID=UPI0006972D35|nr:GNAT family N-acetyltransferase [Luteipulveratus mongoliensis]